MRPRRRRGIILTAGAALLDQLADRDGAGAKYSNLGMSKTIKRGRFFAGL
jgi:hypothetical protein